MSASRDWGVLVAGLGGFTGTSFALGVRAHQLGLVDAATTITHHGKWTSAPLPSLDRLVVGGWDTTTEPLLDRAHTQRVLPSAVLHQLGDDQVATSETAVGVRCRSDFGAPDVVPVLDDPVGYLRGSIRSFKATHGLERVVVVILLPPELPVPEQLRTASADELMIATRDVEGSGLRASQLYTIAALHEQCPVVDFTANASLELPGILELAESSRTPVAGRDGSTGETALKLHLADFLRDRDLSVVGWYGTNILGNPDGLALTDPQRRTLKMRDKTEGLSSSLGYEVPDHTVSIEHHRPRGDNKEFWDAIDIETWLGGSASLRLNWIGPDSLLAGQILCDVTRIVASDLVADRSGIVAELGYFFKHPLGTSERSLARLWDQLHSLLG